MRPARECVLLLAVFLPTSWNMARADEMGAGGSMGGDNNKAKKKDDGMGGAKGGMDKK